MLRSSQFCRRQINLCEVLGGCSRVHHTPCTCARVSITLLSKLLLISKRFPKELDTIEINNILKFQQNSWTTNRHHIKFKFSFKLGLGFSWLMQRVGPLPPQQHMAEKHQQITAKSILGKTKVERVDFALPHNLTLPIFYLCCPLLESTKPYSS